MFVLAGVLGACMRSEWRKLLVSDGGFNVLTRGELHYLALQKHLCHQGQSKGSRLHSSIYPPQHFLNFFPLPHGQCIGKINALFLSIR
ncbi:MAG TPA: hypothetical protein VE844_16190, partial [Gammaproteobacteria bacterium]|nr:hypothetical protein [Gammaproteobacteria bacterium]